ncbi:CTP synthase [Acrasis kona]|uniref:CTP synthase n=1 Tax=Acrasis kona TaxID=1008807 RepID=A0AAW2ZE42_9EUKA
MVKYVLVTGGVLSGLGKGIIASSIGRIMKEMGLIVTAIKIDPYINIDAGTMSPFEHGEVYVLDDGGEVDLDLGNYERFMDITLERDNNLTTGKVYKSVIDKERKGEYLGKTVQVVPHICDEIQDWIERVAKRVPHNFDSEIDAKEVDVCVIELGGTVGDIESMPFIEAMRQFQFRAGRDNFCEIMVSLVPVVSVVGEQKTKPTQQCVSTIRALGLSPDVIVCRSENPLSDSTKLKLSNFCHVPPQNVIGLHNVSNIYTVPLLLSQQNVHGIILEKLRLADRVPRPLEGSLLTKWKRVSDRHNAIYTTNQYSEIRIAVVGKYTDMSDSYFSVSKSLLHASLSVGAKLKIVWVEATDLEDPESVLFDAENIKKFSSDSPSPASTPNATSPLQDQQEKHARGWHSVKNAHGILVPGGFGSRGLTGKILAAKYARENNVPYLGICLGMQVSVIEFARNVLGWNDANSEEFNPKAEKQVVVFMPEIDKGNMGGTMRLGRRTTIFKNMDCKIAKLYGNKNRVDERHRHRYEVNPQLIEHFEKHGFEFVGQDETGLRQEVIEIKNHVYYVAVQYHPEFTSRPTKPSPPFVGLMLAAAKMNAEHYMMQRARSMDNLFSNDV